MNADLEFKTVLGAVDEMLKLEKRIEKGEALLAELKEKHRRLSEDTIPSLLIEEAGVQEIALSDGTTIAVQKFYSGSVSGDEGPEAIKWLEKNNYGGIVKSEVKIAVDKGDLKRLKAITDALKAVKIVPQVKQTVHPQTLKSWLREMYEAGKNFPHELFHAHVGNRTIVKRGE